METQLDATPLSDREFIIYTPSALKEELLLSLHSFAKVVIFNDSYAQFEISGYRIWNSLFNGVDPLKNFEKLNDLFSPPADMLRHVHSHIEKGTNMILTLKKAKKNNPFHYYPDKWKENFRPGQLGALESVIKKHHSGIVALPGGYGKTRTGLAIVDSLKFWDDFIPKSLIITQNEVIKGHWLDEIDKLLIPDSNKKKVAESLHFTTYIKLAKKNIPLDDYRLIILDEVHEVNDKVLDVLGKVESLKIGLTASPEFATDLEEKVFLTIGPIYFLDQRPLLTEYLPKGKVNYFEITTPLDSKFQTKYFSASNLLDRFKTASKNPIKDEVVAYLLKTHFNKKIIIIGEYLEQLTRLAESFHLPIISGKDSTSKRKKVYRDFNSNTISCFISSSITNQAIDLPEADCLIQVSGKYQNENEEMQRLGRILRKKDRAVYFYNVITRGTIEEGSSQTRKAGLTQMGVEIQTLSSESLDLSE